MLDFFKGIVDWILEKLNKEGVRKTVLAILLSCLVAILFIVHDNNILQKIQSDQDNRAIELVENHQDLYLASMEMYSQVKRIMKGQRPVTGADYILFLEYHNGSENIATGYQFCKFDVTIEELSDTVPYIQIDNFKDENMYKYDILLSDRVTKSKMSSFTLDEIIGFDRSLLHMLCPNDHTQQIVFYNIVYKGITAGTLIFMYKKDYDIDYKTITNCAADIEAVISQAIRQHNSYLATKKKKK